MIAGIAELRNSGHTATMAAKPIVQVSSRGSITLPATVRRQLGLADGDVLTVEIRDGAVVLTPAHVTEVELYTDERLREFERSASMSPEELRRARETWGLPSSAP